MKALRLLPFVVLAACSAEAPTTTEVATQEGPMASSFGEVAAKANVPRDLLIAVAAIEGGLEIPAVRTVDPDATIPVAGPMHLPTHVGPIRLDTVSFIAKCHSLGLRVDYWTINDAATARRLLVLGADGIMTDDPKLVAPVVRAFREGR